MRRVLAILLLSGCAGTGELPHADIPLRNPTAPVASQTDASLERLEGTWTIVEGAGIPPGEYIVFHNDTIVVGGISHPLSQEAGGRYSVGGDQLWVHWLDADNRTAAMGDPGGARVWIMDRTGRPGERLHAAREILEWYGYDLKRLKDM